MRITRTGLALSLALAIGCHKREKPLVPDVEPVAAQTIETPKAVPLFGKPENSLIGIQGSWGPVAFEPEMLEEIDTRTKSHPDSASAISALVAANGGYAPASGTELVNALQTLGGYSQLAVNFSSVALDTNLARPRVLFAARNDSQDDAVNRPDFNGRLFLAANLSEGGPNRTQRVRTIEFISWNTRRMKFDFGVIERTANGDVELKVLDGVRCFTCHKNHGPILGVTPWSNTMFNMVVANASSVRYGLRSLDEVTGGGRATPDVVADGLHLMTTNAQSLDDSVRFAAERLFERSLVQALARSPAGRAALARLLATVALPGPITAVDTKAAKMLQEADMGRFVSDATVLTRQTPTSELHNLDPEALMGLKRPWSGITPAEVLKFDDLRAAGHRLGEKHVPSNPKAFAPRPVPAMLRAANIVNGAMVARAIGLTNADRRFLSTTLIDAAKSASWRRTWPLTEQNLSERIFTGPVFEEVLKSGAMPDRDDFKDRFVAALGEALRFHGASGRYWLSRERYASGPVLPPVSELEAIAPVPTTACLGCHDIAKPGITVAFNPIPPLPFDPFDATGRQAWVRSNGNRGKESLSRMLKRLGKDMPPLDSAEHAMFRERNPEMFRAATEFLKRELGRR